MKSIITIPNFFTKFETIKKDMELITYTKKYGYFSGHMSERQHLYHEVSKLCHQYNLWEHHVATRYYNPKSTHRFKNTMNESELFKKFNFIHTDYERCLSLIVFIHSPGPEFGVSFFRNINSKLHYHECQKNFKDDSEFECYLKIPSIENMAVLFDSHLYHRATDLCDDRIIYTSFLPIQDAPNRPLRRPSITDDVIS